MEASRVVHLDARPYFIGGTLVSISGRPTGFFLDTATHGVSSAPIGHMDDGKGEISRWVAAPEMQSAVGAFYT